MPGELMKAWKSIVEKGYFSSVLVGQDIMPAFKAAFPNEFGVTEDIRVTYLDEVAARGPGARADWRRTFCRRCGATAARPDREQPVLHDDVLRPARGLHERDANRWWSRQRISLRWRSTCCWATTADRTTGD